MIYKPCPYCKAILPAAGMENHKRSCYSQRRNAVGDGRPRHTGSAQWKRTRALILERDHHTCQAHLVGFEPCGAMSELEVAHLDRDWRNDSPANLLALCVGHHRRYDAQAK